MAIKSYIADSRNNNEAHLYEATNLGFSNHRGLVVYTEPLKDFDTIARFAFNPTNGINMNVDGSTSGTIENIHDGEDNSYWTGSNLAGSNFIFNSAVQPSGGAQSIDATVTINNDVALLANSSTINMNDFSALAGVVYVIDWSILGTAKEVEIQARNSASNVGNSVNLSNYINEQSFNVWQAFTIPKADMGLSSQEIDEITVTTIDIGGGQPPSYYLDDLRWEGTDGNGPQSFCIQAAPGENCFITSISTFFVDDVTIGNATAYDKILGISSLTNGINIRRIEDDKTIFNISSRQFSDFINVPGATYESGGDATNSWVQTSTSFAEHPLQLRGNDRIEYTVQDDLTSLLMFRASARIIRQKYPTGPGGLQSTTISAGRVDL